MQWGSLVQTLVLTTALLLDTAYGTLFGLEILDCDVWGLSELHDWCCSATESDGQRVVAGLNYYFGSRETLMGVLYSSSTAKLIPGSQVSLTIHDGIAEMVMSDPNDDDLYQIEIDLDTKRWRPANVSLNFSDEDELEVPEDLISNNSLPSDRRLLDASDLTTVDRYVPQHLPREGFILRVQILYDKTFAANFEERHIDQVIAHSRSFFSHVSLNTTFSLHVLPYQETDLELHSASRQNLINVVKYIRRRRSDFAEADSYVLLSYQDNRAGTIGLAWMGTTCQTDKSLRTAIVEYYHSNIKTAQVLVHEIGHNLGIYHDFIHKNGKKEPRFSKSGADCTYVNGYMDYTSNPNRWTACSVEDLTTYYNKCLYYHKKFCLKKRTVSKFDVSSLGIATTPAPRTTTNSPKTTLSVENTTKLTTSEPQTASTTSAGSTWTTSFAEETSIVTTTYSSTTIISSTTSDMHCIDASKNCVTNHLCWMRWYSDGCLKHCNLC